MVCACAFSGARKSSPMTALTLPTFKWGATRLMRCQLPNSDGESRSPKSLQEIKKEEEEEPYFDPPLLEIGDEKKKEEEADCGKRGDDEKRKRKREAMTMTEFRLLLTRDEIDEVFFAMSRARAPRRPTRRPKAVQSEIEVKIGYFVF